MAKVTGSMTQKGVTGSITQKGVIGSMTQGEYVKPIADSGIIRVDNTVITADNG